MRFYEREVDAMKYDFSFPSVDGKHRIHGVRWIPATEIRAILQISHGMMEFIERYEEFAEYLNRFGFLVVGNDHLGHGRSVNSIEEWGYFAEKDGGAYLVQDMHQVTVCMKEEYPGVPLFLLGHSMGSFLLRRYMTCYGAEIHGAIILGTGHQSDLTLCLGRTLAGIVSDTRGPRFRSTLLTYLVFGRYNRRIQNPKSEHSWLSSVESVVEEYDKNPANTFIFTSLGFKHILDTIAFVKDEKNLVFVPKNLPVLIVSGEEDPVGGYGRDVRKVYEQYRKLGIRDLRLELIPGARHEVLNETNREETCRMLKEWMEERI